MLVDITKGWKGLGEQKLVRGIQGDMEVFPLCCSTGVVKNLRCTKLSEKRDKLYFDKLENNMGVPDHAKMKAAKYLHEMIRLITANPRYVWPVEAAQWYAMSLILQKVETGRDDSHVGGYNNFKAAQVTFFDRLTSDKANKAFRFANSYCTTYSCDHLMEWLATQDGYFGEVYVSPAVPGAHKAKVRGCIFTPKLKTMKEYHNTYFDVVKKHIEYTTEVLNKSIKTKNTQW